MLSLLTNSFEALGKVPQTDPGAVGLGRVSVPGSNAAIQQLIAFARADNSLSTPLGRLTVSGISPAPGQGDRLLISGLIDDDPVTYAPQLPVALRDLAQGREAEFGAITIQGSIDLPDIEFNSHGEVLITFQQPLTIRKHMDHNAGWFRKRIQKYLTTNLIALRINPDHGTPILSGVANWLAPQLDWAD